MSYESFHSIWNCCNTGGGDATLANQVMIKDTQALILTAIANISTGGGTATEAKQDALQAEIEKLTRGPKAC